MDTKNENAALDEGLRRLGGILASPSLVMSYEHTTPRAERAFLRRLGLTKDEAAAFLEALCRHGMLDRGAKGVIASVCDARRLTPDEAVRRLLAGEDWPEEENGWDIRE